MNFLVIFLIVKRWQSGMCVSGSKAAVEFWSTPFFEQNCVQCVLVEQAEETSNKNYIRSLKSSNITSSSKKPLKTTDANATDVKVSDLKMNLMNPFFVCNAWHIFYPRLLLCR